MAVSRLRSKCATRDALLPLRRCAGRGVEGGQGVTYYGCHCGKVHAAKPHSGVRVQITKAGYLALATMRAAENAARRAK